MTVSIPQNPHDYGQSRGAVPGVIPRSLAPPAGPMYKWAVVGMLWFICFFNYADRLAISSALPILEQDYGFNKEQLGLISSAFMWIYALTAPLAGQVGDRYSRKVLILGGLAVWSVITGLTALCTKVWHFVLVRGSEGLGETFYFPASMSLVSDYHSKRTRSTAMSIHQTSVYAGTIAGGLGTAVLIDRQGLGLPWQTPFWAFGIAGLALALVLWFFVREPGRNEAERQELLAQGLDADAIAPPPRHVPLVQFLPDIARTPTVLLMMVAFIAANVASGMLLSWTTLFVFEKFGKQLSQLGPSLFMASFAMLLIQVGSVIGSVLGGIVADRVRHKVISGRILVQATGMLLGGPFLSAVGLVDDLVIVAGALLLLGMFKGIYDSNIWASLYDVVEPARRGTAVGLMNMVGWLGAAGGTYVVGLVVNQGTPMSRAFAMVGGVYVFGGLTLFAAAFLFAPRDIRRLAS
ncbi:MAG: MFS transporter [Pirellulales bacterium]|nr:MFS transporter [Pirellulales bacterium]